MRKTDLISIKNMLLSQRSSILNKSFEFAQERSDFTTLSKADEAEVASHDVDLSISYQMHERGRGSLMLIDKALSKISEGVFGNCESCGVEISELRLLKNPHVQFCIDCQEEQEKSNGRLS